MIEGQWIFVGLLTLITVIVLGASLQLAKTTNAVSKFAMTLLLDGFLYQQQRIKFLKLIEVTKAENQLALYYAAMLDLEDAASRNAIAKQISFRMWQLNQTTRRTSRSVADLLEAGGVTLPEHSNEEHESLYPNHDKNTALGRFLARLLIGKVKFKHRLRTLLIFWK